MKNHISIGMGTDKWTKFIFKINFWLLFMTLFAINISLHNILMTVVDAVEILRIND